MKPVRLASSAVQDIEAQVPGDLLRDFRSTDLRIVLEAIADAPSFEEIGAVAHGPGWRISLAGIIIAGLHLFITEDLLDPRPHAVVVYAIDVWLEDFPD